MPGGVRAWIRSVVSPTADTTNAEESTRQALELLTDVVVHLRDVVVKLERDGGALDVFSDNASNELPD